MRLLCEVVGILIWKFVFITSVFNDIHFTIYYFLPEISKNGPKSWFVFLKPGKFKDSDNVCLFSQSPRKLLVKLKYFYCFWLSICCCTTLGWHQILTIFFPLILNSSHMWYNLRDFKIYYFLSLAQTNWEV